MQTENTPTYRRRGFSRAIIALVTLLVLFVATLMWWWDTEPPLFDPAAVTQSQMQELKRPISTGATTTATAAPLRLRDDGTRSAFPADRRA
ncbi:MAG: DUF2333 family protein, partial [Rhodanobacter sp.]